MKKSKYYIDDSKLADKPQIVYMFYFDYNLCAWTSDKDIKKKYISQRMKNIICKRIKFYDFITWRQFMNNYKAYQILEIPLIDSNGEIINILGTYAEENELGVDLEILGNQIEEIFHSMDTFYNKYDIPEELLEACASLLRYALRKNPSTNSEILNINSFKAFIDANRSMFIE